MFRMSVLPKHKLLEHKVVEQTLSPAQFQPAGVDLTLREVHLITSAGTLAVDNSARVLSETEKIDFASDGFVFLKKGAYKILYNEIVNVPADAVGIGLPRSSLLRCGADIRTGLWDPGYRGRSESLLLVHNEAGLKLQKDAKVLQLIFVKLTEKAAELYSGRYKGENI